MSIYQPYLGFESKDEMSNGVLGNYDSSPFDMVYSTPPPSPDKSMKMDSNLSNNVNEINIPNMQKNDDNCNVSLQQFYPFTMSNPIMSTEPFVTSILNNGIVLPRTSIITVDPLVYMQLLQQSYKTSNIFTDSLYPQILVYQQLLNQQQVTDQQEVLNNVEVNETPNPKKRKSSSNKRPQRRVRPKVIPEKGATQCIGMNRKKNQRCRNAALMEYIGPKPKYCAEHIHLDPECLYMKCGSKYQKVPGDKKGCREIVLKEFGLCYKHYKDSIEKMIGVEGYKIAVEKLDRVNDLLDKLESEAMKAKKTNADLYQRKNKLIPKFLDMKNLLNQHINKLKVEGFSEESTK